MCNKIIITIVKFDDVWEWLQYGIILVGNSLLVQSLDGILTNINLGLKINSSELEEALKSNGMKFIFYGLPQVPIEMFHKYFVQVEKDPINVGNKNIFPYNTELCEYIYVNGEKEVSWMNIDPDITKKQLYRMFKTNNLDYYFLLNELVKNEILNKQEAIYLSKLLNNTGYKEKTKQKIRNRYEILMKDIRESL